MKINLFLTIFISLITNLFSQQVEMFGTGNSLNHLIPPSQFELNWEFGTKVKFDSQGLPVIVSIGADGRFYVLKKQNNKFLAPVPIASLPVDGPDVSRWDFDVDVNGVVHIGGYLGSGSPVIAFYVNSIDGNFQTISVDTSTLFDWYVRVLRTSDNQLYVNYIQKTGKNLRWIQLVNPSNTNLNKIINNLDLSYYEDNFSFKYYIFTANKNLYLNLLYGYWIFLDNFLDPDTFYAAYRTIKLTNTGIIDTFGGAEKIQISGDFQNHLIAPLVIADNNSGNFEWLYSKIRLGIYLITPTQLQLFDLRALYFDNSNNLHLLKKINNQLLYSVYTPSNLPINASGSYPYREILIPEEKITYRSYPVWDYSTDNVSLCAKDLNFALVLFPDLNEFNSTKFLNMGSSLLTIQNGNISTEFVISTGNSEMPADNSQRWFRRNDTNYILKFSQYDSVGVQTGRLYLFKVNYENGKPISSISENEIVKLDFPQINPKLTPLTFKTDKNGLIHIVSLTRDTTRYIAGKEEYGRFYLTKEISPGNWTQQFISNDTVAYNYNKHNLDIDDNGVVHFVYSYNYKLYYTNNSTGSFRTPIVVDSFSTSAGFYFVVSVRAVSTDTVYILSKSDYGRYSLYYGNYSSNFTKAQTSFTGTYPPVLEVDKNNNAYVFLTDYTFSNGFHEYYYYKFHFNPISFRRKLLSFSAMSQNVFSIDVARDQNGLVHLIAGYSGVPKIFYGNSNNDFLSIVEYNLLDFTSYNFFNYSSYNGIIKILPVSSESKVYFTMLMGGGNPALFPSTLGWVPYNLTYVDYTQSIIPGNFKLFQNYPNPFNPVTRFKFSLPEIAQVRIEIYNLLGELVYQYPEKTFEAGIYEEEWNGIDYKNNQVSSGIYILKLNAKSNQNKIFSDVKKMILLK